MLFAVCRRSVDALPCFYFEELGREVVLITLLSRFFPPPGAFFPVFRCLFFSELLCAQVFPSAFFPVPFSGYSSLTRRSRMKSLEDPFFHCAR